MNAVGRVDDLLVETVERVLTTASTFDAVEAAEADGWSEPVWKVLAEAGFPWISVPEHAGGSGGTVGDAMAVLQGVGAHAAPVPVAETGFLGGWLAAAAGFTLPVGPITAVPDPGALRIEAGRLRGEAVVAWGARAELVLALVESGDSWLITGCNPSQLTVVEGRNLAGEPRDTVTYDIALDEVHHAEAPIGVDGDEFVRRGALSRVNLAAGALGALSKLTVEYTYERKQFGRPIAAFQAVQQHVVQTAQAAARASMAAAVSTRAAGQGDAAFEIAAARVVVDRASVEATRAAHQAHGAMGVTREYPLHHLSRRLWAWRHEFQSVGTWRLRIGDEVGRGGADALFPLLSR